ncbi:hypothetical protein WJX81_005785 [Elliptochloris bilobata]|uniref:RHOMBOID-like protein n=1 Tax=Elliptochloris bilobata TaxID=381761 RepID=A0AAW1SK86_9CHLO
MLGGPPPAADASPAKKAQVRWKGAVQTLITTEKLVRDADTLADHDAAPAERFAALVGVEQQTARTGRRSMLIVALEKRRQSKFDGLVDRFMTELFITGDTIFHFFTPAQLGRHRLWFTSAFSLAVFAVFCFCIGEFPSFCLLNSPPLPDPRPCLREANPRLLAFGPVQMTHWISPGGATWCFGNTPWMLSGDFLIAWGARWGPLMRRQPWRFVTSWFIHESVMHIEEKYGWWRITLLWVVSALGGNFFSAAFENNCLAVAGASGGIFGMIGLYVADMILNFESIKRPFMRGLMMLAFLCFFIVTVATTPAGTSHVSHAGGFLCGLFPSFLFLPNLRSERWEAWLPFTGGTLTAAVFITLPTYFYLGRLPHLGDCGEDLSRYA